MGQPLVVREWSRWVCASVLAGLLLMDLAVGQTVTLSPEALSTSGVNVLAAARVLRDPGGDLDIEAVRAMAATDGGFAPLTGGHLRKGFTNDVFWVHFRLALDAAEPDELFMVVWPPFLDRVDLYTVAAGGWPTVQRAGDHVPLDERALPLRETVFLIPLGAEPVDYFLRVDSSTVITLSATLKSQNLFAFDALARTTRHGIFLGMIATAALIAGLAAAWLRRRVFVLATAYLSCFFLFQFIFHGNDQVFIYPQRPWLGDNLLGVFACAAAALMAWFASAYLESRPHFPRLTGWLHGLAILMVGFALVALGGAYHAVAPAVLLVMAVILVLMLSLFVGMLRHARARSIAMLVMFLPVIAATLFQIVHNIGLLGSSHLAGLLWETASLSQMPLAAVAILLRIREDQKRLAEQATYQLLVENQVDLVVRVDPEGRFEFASRSYCELFGTTREELLGQRFMPRVHQDDREPTLKAFQQTLRPPYVSYVEQRAWTIHGWRWLGWSDTAVLDAAGKPVAVIGVGRDITDRVEAEQALARSRRQLEVALEAGRVGFYRLDLDTRGVSADERCLAILGYEAGELTLDWSSWEGLIHPEDLTRVRPLSEREVLQNRQALELEYRVRHRSGEWLWLLDRVSIAETDEDGRAVVMTGLIQDITRRKQAEDRLEFLVAHDELTGLLNRRGISEVARHQFSQSRRAGSECCFAIGDLDFFKLINDSMGHEAGDQVLQEIAETLRSNLRAGDWLGRWGGEEFLVILPNSDLGEAVEALERLRRAVERQVLSIQGSEWRITISLGVVAMTSEDDEPEASIARADARLYEAKQTGRNRVCS